MASHSIVFLLEDRGGHSSVQNYTLVVSKEQGRAIKQEMRDCFYCVKDEWRQMIWDRAIWSFERMADGLRKL